MTYRNALFLDPPPCPEPGTAVTVRRWDQDLTAVPSWFEFDSNISTISEAKALGMLSVSGGGLAINTLDQAFRARWWLSDFIVPSILVARLNRISTGASDSDQDTMRLGVYHFENEGDLTPSTAGMPTGYGEEYAGFQWFDRSSSFRLKTKYFTSGADGTLASDFARLGLSVFYDEIGLAESQHAGAAITNSGHSYTTTTSSQDTELLSGRDINDTVWPDASRLRIALDLDQQGTTGHEVHIDTFDARFSEDSS